MMKKISFILICYNGADTVGIAITSMLALSTECESEIILVDDASEDQTLDVFQAFQKNHAHIKIVKNAENSGRAYSRNRGLEVATGDYVFFLDADDFINPIYFAGVPQILESAVDLVVTSRFDFDIQTRLPSSTSHVDSIFSDISYLRSAADLPDCLTDNFITGKFIKRSMLTDNNVRFNEERRNAEDILFSSALWLYSNSTVFHHAPFYAYGRGNYRRSFNREKCVDVLINLSKLKGFCDAKSDFRRKELIANKYAKALVEVINRGRDSFSVHEYADLFDEYFDPQIFKGVPFLRFATDKERNFVSACKSGEFLVAVASI